MLQRHRGWGGVLGKGFEALVSFQRGRVGVEGWVGHCEREQYVVVGMVVRCVSARWVLYRNDINCGLFTWPSPSPLSRVDIFTHPFRPPAMLSAFRQTLVSVPELRRCSLVATRIHFHLCLRRLIIFRISMSGRQHGPACLVHDIPSMPHSFRVLQGYVKARESTSTLTNCSSRDGVLPYSRPTS